MAPKRSLENDRQTPTSNQPATIQPAPFTNQPASILSRSGSLVLIGVPVMVALLIIVLVTANGFPNQTAAILQQPGTQGGGVADSVSNAVQNTTFTVDGTITDAYSEMPVADATVVVGTVQVMTDAQGKYRLEAWQQSEADGSDRTIRVDAPGYQSVSMPLMLDHEHTPTTAATMTRDVALQPHTIQGIVTDAVTGEPVAAAHITATNTLTTPGETQLLSNTTALSSTTSATGIYTLTGVTEQFTLTIDAPGYMLVEQRLSRTTRYQAELRPNHLTGTVTDLYSDRPVAGAIVAVGTITATTDAEGAYTVEGVTPDDMHVFFRADGYAVLTRTLDYTMQMDAALRPDTITARLVDQESKASIANATIIANETLTATAVALTRIDNSQDGQFTLERVPEHGYVQVLAPGYRKAVLELKPGALPTEIALEPFFARSIYAKTSVAANMSTVMRFFDSIDTTELNAIVIDLKSDDMADLGLIAYQSNVPIIKELGTSKPVMDIHAILAEAKRRNIYTIARIHIFAHDNLLAETKPEWAAQNPNGCVPNENRRCNGDIFYADWDIAWLDPWNRNVWEYNIQLGVEAAQLGFDEIQFDYIRFPNDAANLEDMQLSQPIDYNNPQPMYENITTLLEQAHHAFNSVGAFFSVDIFGYAVWSPQPIIGQNATMMAEHSDYIYPMVYPSHFWANEMGFENAAAHPYEIVYESLKRGKQMTADKRALMRPWLQDFTLQWVPDHMIVYYGVDEVRAQIDAVEDFPGAAGWALWDSDNNYTYEALEPE